jgi:GTPase SAR1 family protein
MTEEQQRFKLTEEDLARSSVSKVEEETVEESDVLPVMKRYARRQEGGAATTPVSPVCVIVVGMAGAGKSQLVAQLQQSLQPVVETEVVPGREAAHNEKVASDATTEAKEDSKPAPASKTGYCVNLDPATLSLTFGASIDIRDTVNYKVR